MKELLQCFCIAMCIFGLAACSCGSPSVADDAGADASTDAGTDAGTDASTDAGADASTDAGADASTDAGTDAGTDASTTDGPSGDAGTGLPESCLGLPMTCGANSNDSCCTTLEVVGGTYYRSYDVAGDVNSGDMSNPATVSSFRFDKYEVTVGRFRAFVQAGMGTQSNPPPAGAGAHANIPGSGWDTSWNTMLVPNENDLIAAVKCNATYQTWTDTPGNNENRPMNCVTWYEAMAFCAWDGGYPPTEAEWNYAAAGGDEQRAYPWSSPSSSLTINGSHASYYDGTDCVGDGMAGCALTDLVPVGTKPAGDGRWGQSDFAGNVTEWTLDGFYLYPNPCTDCTNLLPGADRVIRGGSFGQSVFYMRTRTRSALPLETRNHGIGFRCARPL